MKRRSTKSLTGTCSAASANILPYNANRVALLITPEKTADRNLWFGFGQDAVLNSGIGCVLNNGVLRLTREEMGDEICAAVSVISIGAGTFGVLEIIEE